MKGLNGLTVTVLIVSVLVPLYAQGQSKQDGMRMFDEALALQQQAQNKDELKQAVEKYKKALAVFEQVGFGEGVAHSAGNLAIIYSTWGEYDKALDYYEKILVIFTSLRNAPNTAKTLGNIGAIYYHWRQYDKALEYFQKNLEICKRISDLQGERACLLNLGNVQRAKGQYAKAEEYYEKALERARKIGDAKGEGDVLHNLGNVHADRGQYDKAEEVYLKSLDIRRRIKDVTGEGGSLHNLGNLYRERGQYANAAEFYKKGLETARKIGSAENEAASLAALGSLYLEWGQYAKSLEILEQDLVLFRKLRDVKGEGIALNNLGNVYLAWGQYGKAEESYEKALALHVKIGNVQSEGLVLTNLGLVYSHRGEYDKALKAFDRALQIDERTGIPADRPKDLTGNLYIDMGEADKAEAFIKQSNRQSSLGRLYLLRGDHTSAVKSYKNLLNSSEANRNVDDLFTAYTGMGICHEATGQNPEAEQYYRKAVVILENLRSSLNPPERESYFDVRVGGFYRTAPYEGLARVLVKMNRSVEAFKESEYTRARIFAESISKRGDYVGQDVPSDVRDRDSRLTDQLAALSKNLQQAYENGNTELITVLEPQVREAKKGLATHVDSLRKQYPLYAATRYPQPMDLERTSLKSDEWVLAYHVTDPGLVVYATKGKELVKALFKPVPRKEIENLVRRFREPLEMNPKDGPAGFMEKLTKFDFSTGKQLTDVLLGEVLSVFPANVPILVIPDGPLGVLPFEALPLIGTGRIAVDKKIPYVTAAEFFGDHNPLCYCQSVTALTLARTLGKQKKPVERLLVLADPIFHMEEARAQKGNMQLVTQAGAEARLYQDLMAAMEEGELGNVRFSRLALAGELAEDLKGLYGSNSEVYTGFDASKDRFLGKLGPKLDGYDKIVFATHGYFGKDLPGIKEPVLVLTLVPPGTDGFLRMSEVAGLKMNADMVALTACQSGLGGVISGEGTMGMGRAFQYAGAKSVLMTLWSVAESSSVDLVTSFFKHLREGKNKLEALKLARDEIRKAGYDHPFFWAPFILVGEVD
jgi:tetratricopeptide (TPR) repeat protein